MTSVEQALRRENKELQRKLTDLTARYAKLLDRVEELEAALERKKRKPSRVKPPPPPASLDDETRKTYTGRPKAPKSPKATSKEKKRTKPTGRKSIPEHLPADIHERSPEACKDCGRGDFEWVDEIIETKIHVIKEHQRRRIVRRKTGCCKHCGVRTTARSLPSPFARSKATCEWLAWFIHQKFVMLTPLDRLRRDLKSKGIPLSISYMVNQVERVADLLGPIDGEHWKQLLASDWMATDATGLKVLVPKVGCHNGYLEVFRRSDLVVFQYEANKGSEALANKLSPFKGILVADAEHRHNRVFEDGTVKEAGCNAHGRRKFRDAESVQPALAVEGGRFIGAIYGTEEAAKEQGLTGDALRVWRRAKVLPLMKKLRAWMDAVEPILTPSDALAKVIRYYGNHWEALFRFVDYPQIPIDNSASEREFQNVAKLRLNCLFAGSTEGAHRIATILGIAATCKALRLDTQAYLGWALTRLGTHRDLYGLAAREITPAAYAESLLKSG